jgi:rabenosyn-5
MTSQVTSHFSSDDRPTAEASAARKRLLDAFAQYDALAKRIRALPTSGSGSSQDRVLAAVHTRANIFLQKHMFPLQVSTGSDLLAVSC